ncbi:hypothetical protein BV25DRAFT_1818245 [Artomyces pyxidatus]|uniref:Uncharacterized protein n=1 Tax=Artomyces pyxidatus TaxID=48021 RepID=A0ACB8TLH5_9AGAM|nr:hypothetical protein BV25DRAFT_1818245 [Artomyces pyxidatus]
MTAKTSDPVLDLKEKANIECRRGQYKPAIDLYTKALARATPTTATETKRIIIANRGQTYSLWGDIYSALQDVELALSPEYTKPDSPKGLKAKCYFRRSKLRYQFARYEDAKSDYEAFERLQHETGGEIEDIAKEFWKQIQKAIKQPKDSEEALKAELIRAIDFRGITVAEDYRNSFPYLPNATEDEKDEMTVLHFDTDTERPDPGLSNPSATPLVVPFSVNFPGLGNPKRPDLTFSANIDISERSWGDGDDTLRAHLDNLLLSFNMAYGSNGFRSSDVVKYSERGGAKLVLTTEKGRLLDIPWSTKLVDLWVGTKLPRQSACPFKDLRTKQRPRVYEPDGIGLIKGHAIAISVVPKADVDGYVMFLQIGFEGMGLER